MTPHNLAGQRFGLLTVQSRDDSPGITPSKEKWLCQCDCGIARSLSAKSLLSGAMRSCGCQSRHRRQEFRRDQQRFDLATARKQLTDAQAALTEAINSLDAEVITSARHELAEALKRVRDLKSWRALAQLGKGRPQ
jgi:hypothetical protein